MHNLLGMFPVIRTPDNVIVTHWHRDTLLPGVHSFSRALERK